MPRPRITIETPRRGVSTTAYNPCEDAAPRRLDEDSIMTARNIATARAEAAWINRIVDGTTVLTDDLRREIASRTVDNFRDHINKGFLEHRKSATTLGCRMPRL